MRSTRRQFVTAGVAAASLPVPAPTEPSKAIGAELSGWEIARRHRIVRSGATPDFFEGMLLGNGDVGVCVTVRPDAVGFHLGKSDSWDIRVSEEHATQILTFAEVLQLWKRASEEAKKLGKPDMLFLERDTPFFREYMDKMTASYAKTWPRPWPCGIVWVRWDASRFQVVEQSLDPANGRFELQLLASEKLVHMSAFVNTSAGHLCVWSDTPAMFDSVVYYPNIDFAAELPMPEIDGASDEDYASIEAFQLFPAIAPTEAVPHPPRSDKDRNFRMYLRLSGHWQVAALEESRQLLAQGEILKDPKNWSTEYPRVVLQAKNKQRLRLDIRLFTPRDRIDTAAACKQAVDRVALQTPAVIGEQSDRFWRGYWSRSAVEIADVELERWWYHNQYWLGCCLREGKVAPGLFGNWTSGKIGTAWHGDYHMNYNTQQVFWGVFSSNHVDQHLPYLDLVENLLPMSERYAQEKFGLPGAFFPHSAYPVPSQVFAYPAPPWGYEICETPWTVQSLWWHYRYTLDEAILKRAYGPLRAAARFLSAYAKSGPDGKHHIEPTVSPENWGFTVDWRLNRDCIMDLALARFVLQAATQAAEILRTDEAERGTWNRIAANLANYPHADGAEGDVWLDVQNAPTGWIYNVPVTLAPVFPGEQIGLHSQDKDLEIARRTAETIRLEGGNDIVYQPLIRARLGMLDLKWFKQEVRYCLMPNGIVQDRVRQVGGRYRDSIDFDFMMRMGIWTENLSLPVVLNECMLQSYTGVLHLFPNTKNLGPARFRSLRAVGAFLVSAAWDGTTVKDVQIISERGTTARVVQPWRGAKVRVTGRAGVVETTVHDDVIEFRTEPGEGYRLERT